jgi:hypothetical protein
MGEYTEPGFTGFVQEMPLFFKLFGGLLITLVVGVFLYVIIKGLSTWTSNNGAGILTEACTAIAKRMQVSGGGGDTVATTSYYITFEFEDRSRKEFYVNAAAYGIIVEGDTGILTYQGTRFKGFSRSME